jgi:hypothetical protein
LDGRQEESWLLKEILKDYEEKLKQQNEMEVYQHLQVRTTALHQTTSEDNASIIGYLLDRLKSGKIQMP